MKVNLIQVPLWQGRAAEGGADLGPRAILHSGLEHRLAASGRVDAVRSDIVIDVPPEPPVPRHAGAGYVAPWYLGEVLATCERVAVVVADAVADGEFPVVLGGDHALATGSIVGSQRAAGAETLGLLYFDTHGDFNTVRTSPSGHLHGMTVSAITRDDEAGWPDPADWPEAEEYLKFGQSAGGVHPKTVTYVGLRELDAAEADLLRRLGLRSWDTGLPADPGELYDPLGVFVLGARTVAEQIVARLFRLGVTRLHISFDVDCMDPLVAPGTGTTASGGLLFADAVSLLYHLRRMCAEAGIGITCLDVTEVNPLLGDRNRTAMLAADLIASFFGAAIRIL